MRIWVRAFPWFARSILVVLILSLPALALAEVEVVTTLPTYGSIARFVGGDRVHVSSISRPDEDAHFVKPKPSLALMLRKADLYVTTGLDLELWGPVLVDKSGNQAIRDGQPGFVAASQDVPMLGVPASTSRAAGDIHIYGNPHIHVSPLNVKIIAGNIAAGLRRVDPAGASIYEENLKAFRGRIDAALYGKDLAELLGPDLLDPLARKGTLIPFLEEQSYQGRPMIDLLGGWLGRGRFLRGRKIIAYHKNWIYLTDLFGMEIVDYVEPKPGIPPSARHVHHLIHDIQNEGIQVLLAATYFEPAKPRAIAERTGCAVVRVPLETGGESAGDYFELVDLWVTSLEEAFGKGS